MKVARKGVSRALAVALTLVVLIGAGSYLYRAKKKHSAMAMEPATTPVGRAETVETVVTAVPATLPATAPVASVVPATLPTTHPATAPTTQACGIVAEARARLDRGELLGARALLNEAIVAGQLSEAQDASAKQLLGEINKTVIFSDRRFADDPFGSAYVVRSRDTLQKIANAHDTTASLLAKVNGIRDVRRLRSGVTIKVVKGPFYAVVSKRKFTLELYLGSPGEAGSMFVMSLSVGLGKDDSTPTGKWMVEPHNKLKNPVYYNPRPEGERIIQAGDPKNPLGPYWIGLKGMEGQAMGKMSYGIHGTIEPDSIGKQASMGCIRMRNEDVAIVYDLLVEGKSVVVVKE